jgi:inosose dehydratase
MLLVPGASLNLTLKVFHHHCAGYVETPVEVDKLMEMIDPSLVGLVLDMGHFMF